MRLLVMSWHFFPTPAGPLVSLADTVRLPSASVPGEHDQGRHSGGQGRDQQQQPIPGNGRRRDGRGNSRGQESHQGNGHGPAFVRGMEEAKASKTDSCHGARDDEECNRSRPRSRNVLKQIDDGDGNCEHPAAEKYRQDAAGEAPFGHGFPGTITAVSLAALFLRSYPGSASSEREERLVAVPRGA
jgi:hypothetical protein